MSLLRTLDLYYIVLVDWWPGPIGQPAGAEPSPAFDGFGWWWWIDCNWMIDWLIDWSRDVYLLLHCTDLDELKQQKDLLACCTSDVYSTLFTKALSVAKLGQRELGVYDVFILHSTLYFFCFLDRSTVAQGRSASRSHSHSAKAEVFIVLWGDLEIRGKSLNCGCCM